MAKKSFKEKIDVLTVENLEELSVEEFNQLRLEGAIEMAIVGLEYFRDYQPKNKDEAKKILKSVTKFKNIVNKNEDKYGDIISLCEEIENKMNKTL